MIIRKNEKEYGVKSFSGENEVYTVNVEEKTCTCPYFTKRGRKCKHIVLALAVHKNGGNLTEDMVLKAMAIQRKPEIVSAFHKSIRRGDGQAALYWGEFLELAKGKYYVNAYVKGIIFEETRNMKLPGLMVGDWRDNVKYLAASRKRWELKCRIKNRIYERQLEARKRADELGSINELELNAIEIDNLDLAFELLYRSRNDKKTWTIFEDKIRHKVHNCVPMEVYKQLKGAVNMEFAIEVGWGDLDFSECEEIDMEKVNRWHPVKILAPDMKFSDWVYDFHVSGGARIIKNWPDIRPGKPLPKGVDLRWAGSAIGIMWKEKAFEQYGMDYKKKRWEEVEIPDRLWRLMVNEDDAVLGGVLQRYGTYFPEPVGVK